MSQDALPNDDSARALLRQLAATLAYRAAKVLRDAPDGFADSTVGPHTRRPVQIVAHMADLMAWGSRLSHGENVWKASGGDDWPTEVDRFFENLAALDRYLEVEGPQPGSVEQLIQGPFADALTHVGQLALLRGMGGAAVRPESYARANITIGRVGPDQAVPRREFDGDASRPAAKGTRN